jgi:hypothetical protein
VPEEWGELLCHFFGNNYCNAQFNFLNKFVQHPKIYGYYVWQRQYLEDLKKSGMIPVRLMDSENEEEEGSEGHSNGGADNKTLELSIQNLQWKLNIFFFVVFWLLDLESCIMLY